MNCPKCGAVNTENVSFCSLCNEPFKKSSSLKKEIKPTKTKQEIATKKIRNTNTDKHHKIPGFGDMKTTKKISPTTSDEPVNTMVSSITSWLYPSILATVIVIFSIMLLPKEQISVNSSLGKMILASVLLGFTSGSSGIIKMNFKQAVTGWLLGLSSVFLSFNILFLGGFLLIKIQPSFYTRFFLDSETVIISAFLGVAIVLYWLLENIPTSKAITLGAITFFFLLAISWIVHKWLNPLPIIVLLSWPLGYYQLLWTRKMPKLESSPK